MSEAPGDRLTHYDYTLPPDRIALRPAAPRDSARLLHVAGALSDHFVRDLPDLLAPGDRLVVNDSRVIPASLGATRVRGEHRASVALTLIAHEAGHRWRAFAKPAKRLSPGDHLEFSHGLAADVLAREGAAVTLNFSADPLTAGTVPLPPYIAAQRAADAADTTDYQTVYADTDGSVAAPTAGLHFTPELLSTLEARGVGLTRLTLHVGPGTFLPVADDDVSKHVMHAEWGTVSQAAVDEINAAKAAGGRIIAVGTTALRLLETAASGGALGPFEGETTLFVRPGFKFRVVGGLMTNFHMPKTTLLMLVAAFAGYDTMRRAYDHALRTGYRFASYGDSSLYFR
ncbi:MAG: tRNA preQ1(34) S-adenosylmethionine ribosyltransferase-isomerase QueA [Pseudomonadota bacterium]